MELWDAYTEDGTILLMQRDLRKPYFPGLYEASAGGAVLAGESPYDAAIRELREETGIEVEKLEQIYKCVSKGVIFYGYLCTTNCDKNSIKLQEGETISYLWLTKEEFLKFIESDKYVPTHKKSPYTGIY